MSLPHRMPRAKNDGHISDIKENEMATDAKTKKRSPDFASIEEEAEFWDTHDTTEYEHEFQPVELTFERPLKHTWMLSIRLDKETFDALREIAKPKGLGASTLARMWILEELERVRKSTEEAR
jgi:hypothetical protein